MERHLLLGVKRRMEFQKSQELKEKHQHRHETEVALFAEEKNCHAGSATGDLLAKIGREGARAVLGVKVWRNWQASRTFLEAQNVISVHVRFQVLH